MSNLGHRREQTTQTASSKVVIIPKRALRVSLLLMQVIPFGLVWLAVLYLPRVAYIYTAFPPEDAQLPGPTRFILGGYWFFLIIPLVLTELTFWACRSEKPTLAPVFVMLATALITLVVSLLVLFGLVYPLIIITK